MLGAPKVVLLDEPSTGMDPKSKRFLWDTILGDYFCSDRHSIEYLCFFYMTASFQGSRGAILTTHSMEEADALCSRVGIMVKGELRYVIWNIYLLWQVNDVSIGAWDRRNISKTSTEPATISKSN